jgi:hypothetical protein
MTSLDERRVASGRAAPPSGIMFAIFGHVKQFPLLLTVFSYEFYGRAKHLKKPVKIAKVGGMTERVKGSKMRRRLSRAGIVGR